jgi:hypothetical protein
MPLPSEGEVHDELSKPLAPPDLLAPAPEPKPEELRITLPVHGRGDVVAGLAQAKTFRSTLAVVNTLSPAEREYMRAYAIEAYANAAVWNRDHPDEQVIV